MKTILGISFLAVMLTVAPMALPSFASGSETSGEYSNSRLHVTVPLESLSLKSKDYMLLVDTTPETMTGGHVAVKAPCNDDGVAAIQVLQGTAEEKMEKVQLDMGNMLHELSTHGESCLYHIGLPENPEWNVMDVAIFNPGDTDVKFSPGDSITVFVNSFGQMEGGHHAESSDQDSPRSHDEHSSESEHSEEDEPRHGEKEEESSHSTHSKSSDSANTGHSSGASSAEIEKVFKMSSKLYVLNVRVSAAEDLSGASVFVESDSGSSKITVPTMDQGDSILLRGTITASDPESITVKLQ